MFPSSGGRFGLQNPRSVGVAPAGAVRNRALGRPRVTVRRQYDRLPFSGLDVTGRAGTKARARDP